MSEGQQYNNTNRGAIFVNKKKQHEKQPDRTGTADIEGVEYFISGWLRTSKAGEKYMSLSFTKKDVQPSENSANLGTTGIDPDVDVPF